MFGPIQGKRHDELMLGVGSLADKLRRFQRPNREPYVIYGDPAYGLSRNILAPYRGVRLTDDQQEFNSQMSKMRCCLEWGFGKISQLFAMLDFAFAATHRQILLSGSYTNQLPYLLVWFSDWHIF